MDALEEDVQILRQAIRKLAAALMWRSGQKQHACTTDEIVPDAADVPGSQNQVELVEVIQDTQQARTLARSCEQMVDVPSLQPPHAVDPADDLAVQQPWKLDGKKLDSTAKDGFDPGDESSDRLNNSPKILEDFRVTEFGC